MAIKDLSELFDEALMTGIVLAACTECGVLIQCEPNKQESWCDNCNKMVKVENDLMKFGYA
jgi:hypothetical protein